MSQFFNSQERSSDNRRKSMTLKDLIHYLSDRKDMDDPVTLEEMVGTVISLMRKRGLSNDEIKQTFARFVVEDKIIRRTPSGD